MEMHTEKVLVPRAEDVLHCDEAELDKLEEIPVVTSEENRERGSRFVSSGTPVKTYGEERNFYKMLYSLQRHTQAHHRILVYRFRDKDGKMID